MTFAEGIATTACDCTVCVPMESQKKIHLNVLDGTMPGTLAPNSVSTFSLCWFSLCELVPLSLASAGVILEQCAEFGHEKLTRTKKARLLNACSTHASACLRVPHIGY